MTFLDNAILVVITSLLTAGLVSPITAWLSYRRYRAEKWWEKKFIIYTGMLSASHKMGAQFDEMWEASASGKELTED